MSALDFAREFELLKRRVAELESRLSGGGVAGAEPPRTAYKVSEVARMIGRTPATVRRMIHDGQLSAQDMGGWFAVPASEVERLRRAS